MTGRYELIPVTIACAFVVGVVLALLGSIKLSLAKRLAIDEGRVGGLLAALNVALIPMMLLSGVLIDRCGVEWVLVFSALFTATGLFALALSRTYPVALASILVVGAAGAGLSTAGIVLMPVAFFPAHPAASSNLGNVFFGLGALLTPWLTDALIRGLGFRRGLGLLALLALTPALAAAMTPSSDFPAYANRGDLAAVLRDPVLWLAGLAFLLYYPLEGTIGAWATIYLTDLGYRERRAAFLLSAFWLAFLAARLSAAFLQQQSTTGIWSSPWFVLGLALLAAVVLGNLAGAPTRGSAGWGLPLVGALFGPIFPTLVGILFKHFPEAQWGTAYGAMFAIGATGGLVLPPIMGAYARQNTVQRAFRLPMVVSLLAGAALVLGLWR
jgi:fucose permease